MMAPIQAMPTMPPTIPTRLAASSPGTRSRRPSPGSGATSSTPRLPVGVHDNLFALGGHSLTATRFVARIGDAYGVELPVHQVFVGPTIAELAVVIAAHPDFRVAKGSSRHAELDALSDDDLDALLRAALAQRNRRRAIADGFDS